MATLIKWLRGPSPNPSPKLDSSPAPDEKSASLDDVSIPEDDNAASSEPAEEEEILDNESVNLPEVRGVVSLSTVHDGMALFFTNQFSKASAHFRQYARGSPRLAMMHAFFTFLKALSSHSDGEIHEALATIWAVEKLGSSAASIDKNEDKLELQIKSISGILLQADCHLFGAILQIIQQSFVKCAWNMRKCYKFYESAQKQLEKIGKIINQNNGKNHTNGSSSASTQPTVAVSEDLLNEFKDLEGWSNFGLGLFNLILSVLPPTVMKIAEWVGFGSASREVGLRLLRECQLSSCFMSPFGCLLLLTYYLSMSLFIGEWNDSFLESSKILLDWAQSRYPGGVLFALLESRYARAQCDLRKSIDINRTAIAKCVEFPQMAIMHLYNASWCAFFLRDYEEAAVYLKQLLQPIVIKKTKATGQLELWMEEISKPAASSSSASSTANSSSSSSQPVSDDTYEVTLIPPSHASAQTMYAFHAGAAFSLINEFASAASFFSSAPSYLEGKRTRPRPMDLYAKRKSAQCLLRNEFLLQQGESGKQKLKDLYALDAVELCFVWSGITQMKTELLEKYIVELTEIRKRIVAEMSDNSATSEEEIDAKWNEEDLVKCRLYIDIFQVALKHSDSAWDDLNDLFSASQKWLDKSTTLQQDGTLAYIYYALCSIAWNEKKDRKLAEKYFAKAQAIKGFELYNFHQVKLHSIHTAMKKAAKEEAAK